MASAKASNNNNKDDTVLSPAGNSLFAAASAPGSFMRNKSIFALCSLATLLISSCSPRDFLTRRLAADLIAGSPTFRAQQQLQVRLGVLSNQDYLSPVYTALQHRGWITGTVKRCPSPEFAPPCWDVALTPSGVDTFQGLIAPGDTEKQPFNIPAARRELVAVTGIAKQANSADVAFTWRWKPLNEVGAAVYASDIRYYSIARFRNYDDGWRVLESASHSAATLDEALKNAEPAP